MCDENGKEFTEITNKEAEKMIMSGKPLIEYSVKGDIRITDTKFDRNIDFGFSRIDGNVYIDMSTFINESSIYFNNTKITGSIFITNTDIIDGLYLTCAGIDGDIRICDSKIYKLLSLTGMKVAGNIKISLEINPQTIHVSPEMNEKISSQLMATQILEVSDLFKKNETKTVPL